MAIDSSSTAHSEPENISVENWGVLHGRKVKLYTLENEGGLKMRVSNYGCIMTELHVPDRNGETADILLGYDTLERYIAGRSYFGAVVGRFANRINQGRFDLDGRTYRLSLNDPPNHLHGGVNGFDRQVWNATPMSTPEGPAIRFHRLSPDGEEGYPGNLDVAVVYTLTHANEVKTEMVATTDAPTIVNLAQHNYWNLAGHGSGAITGHVFHINASYYTPASETLIPTGEFAPVEGTPFDFTEPIAAGARIEKIGGYDHNFVLAGEGDELRLAARVSEPNTGRVMTLRTNQPGVQFYSGNFLDGGDIGKGGVIYGRHNGFCLETQRFPDSVNQPDWPSVVLRPEDAYCHLMVAAFTTE